MGGPGRGTARCLNSDYSCADFSYQSGEPKEVAVDVHRLKRMASAMLGAKCTRAQKMDRGSYHEIYVLYFDHNPCTAPSGREFSSCIARFPRDEDESWQKVVSEVATMEYVRRHTAIPVPEIYHTHLMCNGPGCVGAPFVLLERMPGKSLCRMWWTMSFEHKKTAVAQMAGVAAQLGALRFDHIGSLTDASGNVGEMVHAALCNRSQRAEPARGPFRTVEEYLNFFIDERGPHQDTSENQNPDWVPKPEQNPMLEHIKRMLGSHLQANRLEGLRAPYGLHHADLDIQNVMFDFDPATPDRPPRLTAVIDWEHARTEPRHLIYRFPRFILDRDEGVDVNSGSPDASHHEKLRLRRHFLLQLLQRVRHQPEERAAVASAFRDRSFVVDMFLDVFVWARPDDTPAARLESILNYSAALEAGSAGFQTHQYLPEGWVVNLLARWEDNVSTTAAATAAATATTTTTTTTAAAAAAAGTVAKLMDRFPFARQLWERLRSANDWRRANANAVLGLALLLVLRARLQRGGGFRERLRRWLVGATHA